MYHLQGNFHWSNTHDVLGLLHLATWWPLSSWVLLSAPPLLPFCLTRPNPSTAFFTWCSSFMSSLVCTFGSLCQNQSISANTKKSNSKESNRFCNASTSSLHSKFCTDDPNQKMPLSMLFLWWPVFSSWFTLSWCRLACCMPCYNSNGQRTKVVSSLVCVPLLESL